MSDIKTEQEWLKGLNLADLGTDKLREIKEVCKKTQETIKQLLVKGLVWCVRVVGCVYVGCVRACVGTVLDVLYTI